MITSGRAFESMYGRPWWQVGQYQVRVDNINWLNYTSVILPLSKDAVSHAECE